MQSQELSVISIAKQDHEVAFKVLLTPFPSDLVRIVVSYFTVEELLKFASYPAKNEFIQEAQNIIQKIARVSFLPARLVQLFNETFSDQIIYELRRYFSYDEHVEEIQWAFRQSQLNQDIEKELKVRISALCLFAPKKVALLFKRAVNQGALKIVRWFLESKVFYLTENFSPLQLAIENKDLDMISCLLRYPICTSGLDNQVNPLNWVIKNKNVEIGKRVFCSRYYWNFRHQLKRQDWTNYDINFFERMVVRFRPDDCLQQASVNVFCEAYLNDDYALFQKILSEGDYHLLKAQILAFLENLYKGKSPLKKETTEIIQSIISKFPLLLSIMKPVLSQYVTAYCSSEFTIVFLQQSPNPFQKRCLSIQDLSYDEGKENEFNLLSLYDINQQIQTILCEQKEIPSHIEKRLFQYNQLFQQHHAALAMLIKKLENYKERTEHNCFCRWENINKDQKAFAVGVVFFILMMLGAGIGVGVSLYRKKGYVVAGPAIIIFGAATFIAFVVLVFSVKNSIECKRTTYDFLLHELEISWQNQIRRFLGASLSNNELIKDIIPQLEMLSDRVNKLCQDNERTYTQWLEHSDRGYHQRYAFFDQGQQIAVKKDVQSQNSSEKVKFEYNPLCFNNILLSKG